MAKYIQVSTQIYNVYLKYIAPEDIHVYSIDEVMMDVTNYLQTYRMTARELAKVMISDVLHTTGITATAGIGSNLYLCKVAMDIMAKHVQPDKDGVRIAALDEMSYREQLWEHRPLTDFWRVGRGYAKKLEAIGIYTMGDVARCSIGKPNEYYNEELLYRMFGINAELLIDHAWGWEPCRMQDIKAYRPETNSICSGQVLQCPYSFEKARLVVREMAEAVALDLLEKKLVTDQLTLTVGYDIENTAGGNFHGEIVTDRYGRKIPKHAHGTANLPRKTSSARSIMDAILGIYDGKVNPKLSIRRITITANKIVSEDDVPQEAGMPVQFNLFDDIDTCRSVCKMLRSIDMQPDWTVTGKEAVLRAQDAAELKDEYKVYIVDYLMPDMNGIETIRRIRRVIREDVPIIVLAAYDWADFEKEAREAGATAFVAKPIFMSELRSVLTKPVQMEEPKPEETEKPLDYSGKRVLLVEDNALNRELALAILGESGMQIDCAEDGIEAVNRINEAPEDRYDLVLMDIQMPRMDGYTATREIRTLSNNRKANIPIVAMTANAFEEDRKKAFECGMNGHIVKPIDMKSISKVLDQVFKEAK